MDKKYNTYASYHDEPFALHNLGRYLSEHAIGLLWLVGVCVLIYWIDHVTRLNAMMFGIPSPVPGLSAPYGTTKKERRKR